MASAYKTPPAFDVESKSYSRWVEELKAWTELTDVKKDKQGLAVALSLPEKDSSNIRDKVFSDLSLDELKGDDGVKKLMEFMDKLFKKDQLSEAYEAFSDFERFQRKDTMTMDTYIMEFEKLYNKTAKFKMTLPQAVQAFKLLEGAGLDQKDRQLVLTGVNYDKEDTLFTQMCSSLKKFFGKQSLAIGTDKGKSIKIEPAFMADEESRLYPNEESTLLAHGRGYRSFRGGYRRGPSANQQRYYMQGRSPQQTSGFNSFATTQRGRPSHGAHSMWEKKTNPIGTDGYPLKCRSCQSIRHLVKDCPDSYENLGKREQLENAVLFTGNQASEMKVLANECSFSAILDSACSSTVTGQQWLKDYLESLSPKDRATVEHSESQTVFKFGGGTRLESKGKWVLPCVLAGVHCKITTDVVESDIPLLLSKASMKKAQVKLDLTKDQASIFGRDVQLQCTSSGHYCVPLHEPEIPVRPTFDVLISSEDSPSEEGIKIVEKLHKQFGHPSATRLKSLLKDAGVKDDAILEHVAQVTERCDTCKRFQRTPARPVVSLPMATEFNDVVAMDLKVWRQGTYILHLIDMATRFSLASIIRDKNPETIINEVMLLWVGNGLGAPKKFLADNGGEFANEEYKDMCANLNVEIMNTAAYSPWQNGICERNHAVVDDCVLKILDENPETPLKVALVWAVNAKNALQMVYGYSPYQLVFGSNPNLPSVMIDKPPALEGLTTSEIFARHLNALHSGRRAFLQAETSERIRKALRHQVRATGGHFNEGDQVYFKRDGKKRWQGPGRVIGQDGKVVFVRHGNVYIRVPSYRLVHVGKEFNKHKIDAGDEAALGGSDGMESTIDEAHSELSDIPRSNQTASMPAHHQPTQETKQSSADKNSPDEEPTTESDQMSTPNLALQPLQSTNTEQPQPSMQKKIELPRNNQKIVYRLNGSDSWIESVVLSRGGKATGKNWAYLNVQDKGECQKKGIFFDKDVQEWKSLEEVELSSTPESHHLAQVERAKLTELANWKSFNVYEEIPNEGQSTMSTRWVLTEKMKDGQKIIKARLVARGFEENSEERADSPTANKESLRVFLAMTSTMGWEAKTIDIKAAFLQGEKIQREVLLKPPVEAKAGKKIWRLKKCVYGLNDAARHWYFSVRKELLSHGCLQSSIDPGLFYYRADGKLQGLFIMHVDDFIWSGTRRFCDEVIEKVRTAFLCGKEADNAFKYIGLDVEHAEDGILLHQHEYTLAMQMIPVSPIRKMRSHDDLNESEKTTLREIIGQLNWISGQSRPDISFEVLDLSVSVKGAQVSHLNQANKIIKKVKGELPKIRFPNLGDPKDLHIALYSDASYANLSDGVSSAEGYVVFLVGGDGRCCPLSWSSRKVRRVVKSTIAAETLALVDGLDMAIYIGSVLSEILGAQRIPICCYIDNKSLFENIYSTKLVDEKHLRIDIASIKQMIDRGEVAHVKWINAEFQIADSLTKRGASNAKLLHVMESGHLNSY